MQSLAIVCANSKNSLFESYGLLCIICSHGEEILDCQQWCWGAIDARKDKQVIFG